MRMRIGTPGQSFFVIDFETTGIDTDNDCPIEVGIVITDEHFNATGFYSSLIRPWGGDDGKMHDVAGGRAWTESALGAYRVHGITPSMLDGAPETLTVVAQIEHNAKLATKNGRKPVLVSDNIQFEWAFLKGMFDFTGIAWPFHYCGWDSSLLLEATGVGDPKPAHRALADAGLLHAAIVKALDRVRSI